MRFQLLLLLLKSRDPGRLMSARQTRQARMVDKECVTPHAEVKVQEFLGGWKKMARVSEVEDIRAPARRIWEQK